MPITKNGHYVLHSLHGSYVINWIKLSELLVVIVIQSRPLSRNPKKRFGSRELTACSYIFDWFVCIRLFKGALVISLLVRRLLAFKVQISVDLHVIQVGTVSHLKIFTFGCA
jgi:hypothetical protein